MAGKYDKSYLDYLCDYRHAWRMLFTLSVTFLFVSLLGVLTLPPGSPAHTVAAMNLAGLVVLGGLSGYLLHRCD